MNPQLALDIGTRNIVGLLVHREPGGRLVILDGEVLAHEDRAMRDGQVHDIPLVGQRLREVVQALASRHGAPLSAATVAAAGRALRTVEVDVCAAIPRPGRVGPEVLRQLAIQGIGDASDLLGSEVRSGFHCVGYTLGRYQLDGSPLDQPLGQAGTQLSAMLIATFLPRVVTDALVAVVREAGLQLAGLTLEPIAAAEVAVAPTMRALNLALVDVGAGTSDIAVTQGGAVIGYAMVPLAGDLVTETLAQHHLLDFPEAEALKIRWQLASVAGEASPSPARDVLGLPVVVRCDELSGLVQPVLQRWALAVAGEVLRLNGGRPPAAVLAIGGASQAPGLSAALADALGLPVGRVGVRGSELVRDVDMDRVPAGSRLADLLRGPAGVTPLGIATTAADGPGFRLREIGVRLAPPWREQDPLAERYREERTVQVLDLGAATVLDGLLAAGFAARDMSGRPGLGLTVTVDGELHLVPAVAGQPAEVRHAEGVLALDAPLPEDARLWVRLAISGGAPALGLEDLWGRGRVLRCRVDDQEVAYSLEPRLSGVPVSWDEPVVDGGVYRISPTLSELLASLGPDSGEEVLVFEVEGVRQEWRLGQSEWLAGERVIHRDEVVSPGAVLTCRRTQRPVPLVREVMPDPAPVAVGVHWMGRIVQIPVPAPGVRDAGGRWVEPTDRVLEGGQYHHDLTRFPQVADLFALVQDEVTQGAAGGGQLRIEVDGVPAEFTTPLREGSRVTARWTVANWPYAGT
jgi:cell division protein FtsA